MRCPTLAELPPPPPDKTGWPWTEESPQFPDGAAYLGISIITPSLNHGRYIEETIRSVLLQGYPSIEYIIIDGGSTDDSVEIIKKYEKWLFYWTSEPDRGQSHAINKGLHLSKGEIVAWLNSDDVYLLNSLKRVNTYFTENQNVGMAYGHCYLVDQDTNRISKFNIPANFNITYHLKYGNLMPQPSVFFRQQALNQSGFLNEYLHYSMDYDLWVRIALQYAVGRIDHPLSCFRRQSQQKTFSTNPDQYRENLWIRSHYGGIKQKCQYLRHLLSLHCKTATIINRQIRKLLTIIKHD